MPDFDYQYALWAYNGRPESWHSGDTPALLARAEANLHRRAYADDVSLVRFADALRQALVKW